MSFALYHPPAVPCLPKLLLIYACSGTVQHALELLHHESCSAKHQLVQAMCIHLYTTVLHMHVGLQLWSHCI
jgi:hypothetical protein